MDGVATNAQTSGPGGASAPVAPSREIVLATDLALLTAYDPQVMKAFVRQSRAWVYEVKDNDYGKLDPVRSGRIAVWPLGGKGGRYTARIVPGELPEAWRPYSKGSVRGFGVVVEQGQLFVGPGERIPGDGFGDRIVEMEEGGAVLPCPSGRYLTEVFVLDWKHDDRFFDEEGERKPDAPPDLAVVLSPHEGDFAPPRPCPPLLDFLPKPVHKPQPLVLPRPQLRSHPDVARPAASSRSRPRAPREAPDWKPAPDPLPPPKPGEIRVGMRVRHARFGDGNVLFIREGFPKVKVEFRNGEEKVDRSELIVLG